jgi:hypothetical protein
MWHVWVGEERSIEVQVRKCEGKRPLGVKRLRR